MSDARVQALPDGEELIWSETVATEMASTAPDPREAVLEMRPSGTRVADRSYAPALEE